MAPAQTSGNGGKGVRLARAGLVAGILVLGVVVGLLLEGLYRTRPVTPSAAAPTSAAAAPAPRAAPVGGAGRAAAAPAPTKELQAWEVTPANSPPVPPGHVPAWQVKPPPPEPVPAPAAPVEPPDPATYRPPLHNPGGVDGDRPPRQVPGL
jgi:hypothetical protein